MAVVATSRTLPETFAEVWHRLGDVPLHRIRMQPAPGTATIRDVADALEAADKRLYELVDGVLVEKAMGAKESYLGSRIGHRISAYVDKHNSGFVIGADGAMEILTDLVRIPDMSYISWDDVAGGEVPDEPIPGVVPRLAVEVISKSNTPGEMRRKLNDYFEAGLRLVWLVYPKSQSVEVYTAPNVCRKLSKGQSLDGGEVLPGFKLPLKELFASSRGRRGNSN